MIRLIAFSPLEGAAFYEMDGKTFHTTLPFTPSVTEEVENAQELAESTMGYMNGQDRTFENLFAMRTFLGDFQSEAILSNPTLKKNRELLRQIAPESKKLGELNPKIKKVKVGPDTNRGMTITISEPFLNFREEDRVKLISAIAMLLNINAEKIDVH